jgi:hypothetical protein
VMRKLPHRLQLVLSAPAHDAKAEGRDPNFSPIGGYSPNALQARGPPASSAPVAQPRCLFSAALLQGLPLADELRDLQLSWTPPCGMCGSFHHRAGTASPLGS